MIRGPYITAKIFKGNRMIKKIIICLGLCFYCASSALAAVETYNNAIDKARANAITPAGWTAPLTDIITIPDGGGGAGLFYSSGDLVVRTATKSQFYRDNYVDEANYTIVGNPAWVTTGNDFTNFYDNKGGGATNTDLINIIERGLGMNVAGNHDAIVEYSISASNNTIMRPTRNPDITTYDPSGYGDDPVTYPFRQPADMSDTVYDDFKAFYENWRTNSAPGGAWPFPWTELGYTYFWGNAEEGSQTLADVQGLSEFIIFRGTQVGIHGIYSTSSYIYTKNDGQYGNGYASFDVTGSCETLWGGHRFQKRVSHSASSPNTIEVANGVSLSGGQGILVWSLNYNVINDGTITTDGATDKFNINNTDSIAILFKGDTSSDYGIPVLTGINSVTNSGTIKGTAAGAGTGIKIENGNTTINNTGTISGDTAIEVSNGVTSITNTGTLNGDLVLTDDTNAAVDVGAGNVALSNGGVYRQGTGTALKLTANSSTDFGKITAASAVLNASSNVDVTTGGYIPDNSTFTVVNASGAGVGAVPGTITSSSPVFTFAGSDTTGNLVLTATRSNPYNTIALNSNTSAVGSVLESIGANATGDMAAVLNGLDSLTSAQEIDQALGSMLPSESEGVFLITQSGSEQYLSAVVSRLDNFKNPDPQDASTKSVYNEYNLSPEDMEIWTQGFGSYVHQDSRGTSKGYNATVWGTAIGWDRPIGKAIRMGISGGVAQDFIRSKNYSGRTDVNSYHGSIYGTYGWTSSFVDVLGSFAHNTYDSSRHVSFGSGDRIARSDYDGQQYSMYVGGGYKFDVGKFEMTPLASFLYAHIRFDSYLETGADSLNLRVDSQNYDVAKTGLGLKLAHPVKHKDLSFIPEIRFKWLYDWIGDPVNTSSTFTGGGGTFVTSGPKPVQSSYDFGTKFSIVHKQNIMISVNYDLELKKDYYGHYGSLDLRYRF